MADPEVSAKLRITREGDPKAFAEVGDASRDLAARVREARPDLEAAARTIDEFSRSAEQAAPEVAASTAKMAEGLRTLSRSSSAGDLKSGVDQVLESFEELVTAGGEAGEEIVAGFEGLPEALDKFRTASSELAESLEGTGKVAAKLEVPAGVAPGVEAVASGAQHLRAAVSELDGPLVGFEQRVGALRLPLAETARDLSSVGASARETAPEVSAAAEEMAASLDRIGKSESFEDLKANIDSAREALVRLRDTGVESVEGLEDKLKDLEKTLADLGDTVDKIDEPLAEAFDRAGEKVRDFGAKAEAGLGSSKAAGAQAQRAMADLEEEIRRLEASGGNLSEGQVAELEKLKAAHREAVVEVAKNTAAQEKFAKQTSEAGQALTGQIKPIRDVGDLLEGINPQFARTAARVGLVFEAVKVGAEVLDSVQEHLNGLAKELGGTGEEFAGLFDGMGKVIPGVERAIGDLALAVADYEGYLRKVKAPQADWSDQTEELANLQRILRREGIDPANLSLAQARERYQQVVQEVRTAREEIKKLADQVFGSTKEWTRHAEAVEGLRRQYPNTIGLATGQTEALRKIVKDLADEAIATGRQLPESIRGWAKELGVATTEAEQFALAQKKVAESQHLTVESVRKSAQEARALIAQVVKANRDLLSDEDLGKILKKPIQGVIDDAEALGKSIDQVSPKMAEWARHWGIVGTAAEKQAAKHTAAVEALQESVFGAKLAGKELEEAARVLIEVSDSIADKPLFRAQKPEEFAKWQAEVTRVIEAYRTAGKLIPTELAHVADAARVVVYAYERANEGQAAFAGGGNDVGNAMVTITRTGEGAVKAIELVGQATKKAGADAKESAAEQAQSAELVAAVHEATTVRIRRGADGRLEAYNAEGVGIHDLAERGVKAAQDLAAAGAEADKASEGFVKVGQAAESGKAIGEVGAAARQAGADLKQGGEDAGASKGGYGAVADEIGKLGEAGSTAAAKLRGLEEQLAEIETRVAAVTSTVQSVVGALDQLPSRYEAAVGASLPHLDRLLAKLREIANEDDAVATPGAA